MGRALLICAAVLQPVAALLPAALPSGSRGIPRQRLQRTRAAPDDTALWDALARAQMKEAIEALPQMLEMDVGEGGESFSVGQRQLVSLPITARPHNEYINILCSYRSITML